MIRVAINGFGRVGRAFTRIASGASDIEIVAINDPVRAQNLSYLLKYDSVHGKFGQDVQSDRKNILLNGKKIRVYGQSIPFLLPWWRHKPDIVIEATGKFTSAQRAGLHRLTGAKKVMITAIPTGVSSHRIPMFVVGVNEHAYANEPIFSASSCTTNCAGPVIKALHEAFVLENGIMTCVHAYTRNQALLDGAHGGDWRRGRAAGLNIVPARSGAADAVSALIPGLRGKLKGSTVRVPISDGSLLCISCTAQHSVTEEEVNTLLQEKSEGELHGVVSYARDPIVSVDATNDLHSAVFDPTLTTVLRGHLLRVVCWFDHEYGYAARLLDLVRLVCNYGNAKRNKR
jgi:glyceraldehyde 3-phosphate dehydrogenase